MSDYVFSPAQRLAVFKVFDFQCPYCKKQVQFENGNVDHVIPEYLIAKEAERKHLLETYGLNDGNFNINDYENWVPSHPFCNKQKGEMVLNGSMLVKKILNDCAGRKAKAQEIEAKTKKIPKAAKLIATIEEALKQGVISEEMINKITEDYTSGDDSSVEAIKDMVETLDYNKKAVVHELFNELKSCCYAALSELTVQLGKYWNIGIQKIVIGGAENGYSSYTLHCRISNAVDEKYTVPFNLTPVLVAGDIIVRNWNGESSEDIFSFNEMEKFDPDELKKVIQDSARKLIVAKKAN